MPGDDRDAFLRRRGLVDLLLIGPLELIDEANAEILQQAEDQWQEMHHP